MPIISFKNFLNFPYGIVLQLELCTIISSRTHSSLMGRREELGKLDESDLFMELIRDVANELDINILCHKILVNVGLLTHADRGSLFLAKGPLEDRYLVAKLFDVRQDTELEEAVQRAKNEEIKIPFGVGIAGYVAQTKEIINIKDAYKVSYILYVPSGFIDSPRVTQVF